MFFIGIAAIAMLLMLLSMPGYVEQKKPRHSVVLGEECRVNLAGCGPELEEAQRLDTVADQQVFSLLIVIQHHFVSLTPDTRLLITAKGGVRRIEVITVGPDALIALPTR